MHIRLVRFLVVAVATFAVSALLRGQSHAPDPAVAGTWDGPVHCLHGGGDAFTMTIARDADGRFTGTMDWALATSDGKRAPGRPFTTLSIDGTKIAATAVDGDHKATLDAVVEGRAISGQWRVEGNDDVWTFTGTRR